MKEWYMEKFLPFLRFAWDQIVKYFYVQKWNAYGIVTFVFHILMLITIGACGIAIVKYLKDYQIFESIFAKIAGDAAAYDKIQRRQRKKEAEERNVQIREKSEKTIIDKIYDGVAMTGLTEVIPGFSESGFLLICLIILVLSFIIMTRLRGWIVGLGFVAAIIISGSYAISIITYQRRMKLEAQLLQFIDSVSSASVQFANLIDIFGVIYHQFKAPLRKGLEACYVEAKQTSNKDAALRNLVRKYDSAQFAFIIDNLKLCSDVTGDYRGICKDLADTVAIYSASHKAKQAILRNSKIQISIMFVMAFGIMYSLNMFLGGLKETLLETIPGNFCLGGLFLLYFYGMNIKAEK